MGPAIFLNPVIYQTKAFELSKRSDNDAKAMQLLVKFECTILHAGDIKFQEELVPISLMK